MSDERRRWWFYVETEDEEVAPYLDKDGSPVCCGDSVDWIGTKAEAMAEGDRRADLYEEKSNILVGRIVSESRGRVGWPWALPAPKEA